MDIANRILREVKAIHEKEGRAMGVIVSELLADVLARRRPSRARPSFRWTTGSMRARVDLADKDSVDAVLDGDRS